MSSENDTSRLWRQGAALIPVHAARLLAVHDGGIAAAMLSARSVPRQMAVLEPDPSRATALQQRFDRVVSSAAELDLEIDFMIMAPESERDWGTIALTIREVLPKLNRFGGVLVIAPGEVDVLPRLRDLSLAPAPLPREFAEARGVHVFRFNEYDRFAHAAHLAETGHPDWAVQCLADHEEDGAANELRRLNVMHRYLDEWERGDGDRDRERRFFLSHSIFMKIVDLDPFAADAFRIHARFWDGIGDVAMADRLRRTISFARDGRSDAKVMSTKEAESDAPRYEGSYKPRVLMILEPQPDYGSDVLFDGLADALGDDRVVEYPWKPTLHGQPPETQKRYPCLFEREGRPIALNELVARLGAGRFDAVLYCAHTQGVSKEEVRAIIDAAGDIPIGIVDQSDSPVNQREAMAEYAGIDANAPYFKREMLACLDYGADAFPLPFAYASVPSLMEWETRSTPLFWAGHRKFGLRRLYLEHLEKRLGKSFVDNVAQEEYARRIASARIGLSFFGFGFDTVRYWELPAHGCMLLSERLPIRVPHNFVDGESAVFFDDLEEVERRLVYYLERPAEAERIARAGRAHFERYHTGAARARQLLARMEKLFKPA